MTAENEVARSYRVGPWKNLRSECREFSQYIRYEEGDRTKITLAICKRADGSLKEAF